MKIFGKPSRAAQASLKPGYKFRFLHIGDDQPVFGPGDGHIKKPHQPFSGFISRNEPIHPNQVNQIEVQPLGAVDADQGNPVGGDVKKFLGPDVLGDPLGGDAGCFQLFEQAGGRLFALVFEVIGPLDLVVV
jgi:hypothetical protein